MTCEKLDTKIMALEQGRLMIFQLVQKKADKLEVVDKQVIELESSKVNKSDQQQVDHKLDGKLRKI